MDEINNIQAKFIELSKREPVNGDVLIYNKNRYEFHTGQWKSNDADVNILQSKVIDSKDFHIRSLESMLRKAVKFKISPVSKHNIVIEREKEKDSPYFYVVKKGYTDWVDIYLNTVSGVASEDKKKNARYNSLVDAFSVAERYLDMLNEKE